MFVPHLQTKGVFCCHCHFKPDHVRVGIFAVNPKVARPGQIYRLTQPNSPLTVLVRLPDPLYQFDVKVKLDYVNPLSSATVPDNL